ncbi:transmembrane and coiled-coil domain-containing protein 3 isoform X1 [Physeter macrocephalus]|uniref:Transmembrane and coiled-coil domain-containing protein 3 isoform X1 n=1 Tax=Physeter macrocephalus TaxID=9755 RepID=A0A2Y9S3R6_PHYMC|nr:transmembrane and coiled-coil domain-containing protein 3 isoform X1 [Physeter catodon]|eukprot:XP_023973226.1 transmembrane and coiled-coil domain-containing protein 3 isoform X1 [Physeter catodon]
MKVLGKSHLWMWLPFLHLLASGAEHEEVVRHAIELRRGQGAAVAQRRQWVLDGCRKLSGLLRQKAVVLNKLKSAVRAVEKDASLSDEEKLFQVHMFEIFQKELNESENSVFQAIHGLQRALQGDYRDVVNVKESSRQRLEALRKAAIKEETEYVELLAAEKHQVEALKNMQHRNKSLSLLDEILEDVRKAADRLEKETEERAFDDNKSVRGVNFEAVLRVEEEEASSKQNLTKREVEEDLGLSMLIDSQNNQYILTKPRDATIPRADPHLIKDIVTIGMLSLPCGWLCTMIGLPTMFGYIICGVLLGPSGLNSIKSVVQVETLGEFGVFFTLFLVGLEFSPEKLRKVWKISLQGPCYMTLLMVAFGLVWGHLLQIRPTQSVFISACLSLSSTPLVSKFLVGSTRSDKEGDIDYGAVLLGMLVTQDVQLGLVIAVLPTFIQAGAGAHARHLPLFPSVAMEILRVLGLVGQVVFSLAAVLLFCLVVRTYLVGPYCRKLHAESKGNKEILILGISAFIFLMLTLRCLRVSRNLGRRLRSAFAQSCSRHRAPGRVHGAGLLPGRSPGVLPGSRGRRGGRFLRGARPRLPGHRVLRVHRPSRVPHLRAVRAHRPAGPHALGGGHEVRPGSPGPVSAAAQDQPVRQVDRGRGAGPGQRVLSGPGEPGAQSTCHLSGGVPPHPECDHAQPPPGPAALASGRRQVCAPSREKVQPLRTAARRLAGAVTAFPDLRVSRSPPLRAVIMHHVHVTLRFTNRLDSFAWMCLFFRNYVNFLLLFHQFMFFW